MTFQTSKSKASSVTLWGAGLAILAPLASLAGYQISEADTASVVTDISMVVGGIGGVIAFLGRLKANKTVR